MVDDKELDEAFQCIERGNAHESSEEFWDASAEFSHATELLAKLAVDTLPVDEEAARIAHLYHMKSREYFHRSRLSLIEALAKEDKTDEQRTATNNDPLKATLSDDDAECRVRLFMVLFSKEIALQSNDPEASFTQQAASLEERLMELNASLPSGFKSDAERMSDINRGLRALGLSSTIATSEKSKFDLCTVPLSPEEQIIEIIAQAKDEARIESIENRSIGKCIVKTDQESIDSDFDDGVDVDPESDSSDNAPPLSHKNVIRDRLVEAQVKLAELVALLSDQEQVTDNFDAKEVNRENIFSAGGNAVSGGGFYFDEAYGQKLLRESRSCLTKALKVWSDDMHD